MEDVCRWFEHEDVARVMTRLEQACAVDTLLRCAPHLRTDRSPRLPTRVHIPCSLHAGETSSRAHTARVASHSERSMAYATPSIQPRVAWNESSRVRASSRMPSFRMMRIEGALSAKA